MGQPEDAWANGSVDIEHEPGAIDALEDERRNLDSARGLPPQRSWKVSPSLSSSTR